MLALRGVKVLDIATLFPAPLLAAMLGDFGADVVKLEDKGGDPLRVTGAMKGGQSYVWSMADRNKRSIELDLKSESGRKTLQDLTSVADVIIANQPRRVLERLGCTYEEVSARNPRAVMVVISSFGTDGPYSERPGNGTLAEAFGGFTHLTGDPEGPPVLPSAPLGDCLGALSGLIGTLVALYWRDAQGGKGQYVDASMFEPVLLLVGTALVAWTPGTPSPIRTGSQVPGGVPRNVYRTADGKWLAVSGPTDQQVARILEMTGRNSAEDIARWGTSASRLENGDALDALVAQWISERDSTTVLGALENARIPVMTVNDLAAIVADPHIRARQSIATVSDPASGDLLVPGPFPHLSQTPGSIWRDPPRLGADSEDVLGDWLEG